jgi:hypothetical protein
VTDAVTPAGATPIFALPPVPLTDDFLLQLAADDEVQQLWVPTARPASVTTRAGVHEGDILKFWIERAQDYTPFEYRTGEAGLRWYRFERTTTNEELGSILAEHLAGEAWTPLAVHPGGVER